MRACLLILSPLCATLAPLQAGEPGTSDLARAELQRRGARAAEAQELVKKGDEAYEAGRFGEAAQAYRGALDLLPEGAPAVAELRRATAERFAQASVERAREQRRLGDVEGALGTVEGVLAEGAAPGNIGALAMQEQILDPIRTNPAGSAQHTRDVEEVRLLLYKAGGAHDLGKFDEAMAVYEDVLRVDPTNKAARRGMERTIAAKRDYFKAAQDQTRAEMLDQVSAAWELKPPPLQDPLLDVVTSIDGPSGTAQLEKMKQLVLPVVALDQVSLEEAVDFVRQQSIGLDTYETDPDQRGINLVVDLGAEDSEISREIRAIRFDINLRNVPVEVALQYISDATRTVVLPQQYAVVIRPAGAVSEAMITKSYRVPPDFLTAGSAEASGTEAADNPFGEAQQAGLVPRRLTAEEILTSRGVVFPEGASASFNSGSSTLRVTNTVTNHMMVEQIAEALANSEPTAVIVSITYIKTQRRHLEELSFDWMLGEFNLGGEGIVPGSAAAFLTGGTPGNGSNINDVAVPAGEFSQRPLTAGNRSGTEAISGNSIDELILKANQGFASSPARAPGALWVNGVINNTNVTALMRGLSQKTNLDMVARPSVVTRSGQAAAIRVIREFIYPTEYEPPELPNSVGSDDVIIDLATGQVTSAGGGGQFPVTPATPTAFTMRETGVILEVLPTVSADKRLVDITLKPEIVDFDGFVNYGSPILSGQGESILGSLGGVAGLTTSPGIVITPNRILQPVFSTMRTDSSLTVADNATIVIGGLFQERTQNVEDQTPILGSIPGVGRLFQSKASAPVQTAIVIMVHVRVVDAGGRPFHP